MGLKPDQAVITPDGIIGKLRDVFPHTSQVLLINDQTSGAGVVLATTRFAAILRGSITGQILINNLTPDSRIKPGEQVLTSGGDQVYPRGLPVGTIESIAPDPEHQPYTLIQLRPAANLNQLEEVLVITGTQTTLPPAAQHDLAVGAATAEAQAAAAKQLAEQQAAEAAAKSAAQIVADRLPGLHDPDHPENDAAPATTGHPRWRCTQTSSDEPRGPLYEWCDASGNGPETGGGGEAIRRLFRLRSNAKPQPQPDSTTPPNPQPQEMP